jgi:hypothetical protein
MRLYLIDHDDEESNNYDLLIIAATPDDAVQLWWDYYEFGVKDEDDINLARVLPDRMFDVMEMPAQLSRALRWYGDIKEVDDTYPVSTAKLALSLT